MNPPFDTRMLDQLMKQQGVSLLLATTRHNVQYLLGGYRYFFFANMDAIGISRYLPILGYARERVDDTFYIGAGNEAWGTDAHPIWVPEVRHLSWSSVQAAAEAAHYIKRLGLANSTIAVEYSFIPADALDTLRRALPDATFVKAHPILETLRGTKSEEELVQVRAASEKIITSMTATFGQVQPGMTRNEIVEIFRNEQTSRGLVFDYCLIATGPSLNRAPSEERWNPRTVLSLDSGGMYNGYIGDLARMAVHGQPTQYMTDLMDEIESVQQAVRTVVRHGARGGDLYDAARSAMSRCEHTEHMTFLAHGMGLITHEVPRLTATGPVPYPADHAELPLQAGNILSIETWIEDPTVGFVKLEDTLIVTTDGYEAPGDFGRGYNVIDDD